MFNKLKFSVDTTEQVGINSINADGVPDSILAIAALVSFHHELFTNQGFLVSMVR